MLVSDLYCPSCRNAKDHKPQDNEVCWSCVAMGGAGNYKESKTHYDLLIRKTPEELAELFKSPLFFNKPWCCLHEQPCRHLDSKEFKCAECLLDWLRQEAEDG